MMARGSANSRPLASWCIWRTFAPSLLFLAAILASLSTPGLAAGDAAAGATADAAPYLLVTTAAGEVLVNVPLPADHTWQLEWTHSVAQVQVIDQFAWRHGTMYVTDQFTPYLDIAGLGNFAGRGDLSELADGSYHLSNIDLALHGNVHNLIIGSSRAPSVLIVGERRFRLSESHPATHARIEVQLR